MKPQININDLDQTIWQEELDDFVPARLFDMHTHMYRWDFNTDPDTCRDMAATGHGRVYTAPNFQSLPRTLHRLIADLLA